MEDDKRPKGIEVKYESTYHLFSSDTSDVSVYLVTWALGLGTNMLASYLYDLIKKQPTKPPEQITINRRTVTFEKGEIKKIIDEEITRQN